MLGTCRTSRKSSDEEESEIGKSVNSGCRVATATFHALTKFSASVIWSRGEDNHRGRFDSTRYASRITVTPLSLCPLVFRICSSSATSLLFEAIDAAAPNASMSSIPNGSGPELEKFPDAPPSIEVTAPEETPHAGLRSLDHCMCSPSLWVLCPRLSHRAAAFPTALCFTTSRIELHVPREVS